MCTVYGDRVIPASVSFTVYHTGFIQYVYYQYVSIFQYNHNNIYAFLNQRVKTVCKPISKTD